MVIEILELSNKILFYQYKAILIIKLFTFAEPSMTETEVSTSSQPETVVVEPQQTTSLQQQSTVVTPMSQQTSTAVATPIVQPTVQPSTSAGTSREGAAKRTREDR